MIYLDYAAATPVHDDVFAAAQPYYAQDFYNPSAFCQPAKHIKATLNGARGDIAQWLGCRAEEVVFTAGGTEANNLAIKGVMERFPGKRCVISAIEHESVRAPAHRYATTRLSVKKNGVVDTEALEQAIDDETVLVSVMYANNEIGTVQPLKKIAATISKVRQQRVKAGNDLPLYFHTDACQAPNYLNLQVHSLGVDLMTLNGGKIYGFKQSGCLYVNRGVELLPLIDGGGQERGLRSGTENVPQSVGLAAAIDRSQRQKDGEVRRVRELQAEFMKQIESKFTGCFINGSKKYRLPNNIHVTFPGQLNEMLLLKLEQHGILAAAGSACSANEREKPSYVLEALGLSEEDARASIRFSLGEKTTAQDIAKTVAALEKCLQ